MGVLQGMVDKVRNLSPGLMLGCCKGGTLHLAVREAGLHLGSELQPLPVVPASIAADAAPLMFATLPLLNAHVCVLVWG
jgi:hypothetical protein